MFRASPDSEPQAGPRIEMIERALAKKPELKAVLSADVCERRRRVRVVADESHAVRSIVERGPQLDPEH